MPDITWADEFFPVLLRPDVIPLDAKTVLDVGCGRGLLGSLMRIYREPTRVVGIDIHQPYLDFVGDMGTYDTLLKLDLAKDELPFGDKEFDVVVCLEVLEHLKKEDGLRLLERLERVGERVIVSTPTTYYHQATYDKNPHQAHVSLYKVRELEARGYRVHGVGSLLVFGREVRLISDRFGKLTFRFPRLSGALLAIKDSSGSKQTS